MSKPNTPNRRQFMARASAAAGAAASFHIVPRRALAASGEESPSDRVITGAIGAGGRGGAFLRPGMTAAVCDVDQNHLDAAVNRLQGTADPYTDYRELLEREDLDAVFIASPDHWHGLQTIHACQAGKDVYVEKPACKIFEEGQEMIAAAKRYGRVIQVGSQGRSTDAAHKACQYIRNGELGRVNKVTCWHYPNPVGDWTPDQRTPETIDWDLWIGPARYIPYNPQKCHFNFRWLLDFGGGQIRDRGAHVMSVALWCMNQDDYNLASVEASGTPPKKGVWDCPVDMKVTYTFENPDWTMTWEQPGEPLMGAGFGAKYWGEKDNLIVTGGDGGCGTEPKAMEYTVPEGGVEVFKSPGHVENFLNCVKTREKPLMHIEAGVRTANLCILGNIAYRLGRKLEWDNENQCVKNDAEANRMLQFTGRGQYVI